MWLVFCHNDDHAALWAYQGLMRRGLAPLELVSAESLAFSLRWEHRVESYGASFQITLADGRQLASRNIFGVLNRLQFVPAVLSSWIIPEDRNYFQQEMSAFYTSWLFALRVPVLNPATALGMNGTWRTEAEWTKLADRAGLSTTKYRSSADPAPVNSRLQSIIVINGEVTGGVIPSAVAEGCCRLAALSQTPLLGINLKIAADGICQFEGATSFPDLRLGGAELLDSLKSCLEHAGGRS